MTATKRTLVVCGGGLAGRMAAASLAGGLGTDVEIMLLEGAGDRRSDIFYGSVTAPTGYDFYRAVGLDEPTLFLNSATSFSYGTLYKNWPGVSGDWLQCHHLPFPVIAGVPLQHHLTQHSAELEPLLISAQAARRGVFAHPPQDPASPLSRAEYGYQFNAEEWTTLLGRNLSRTQVKQVPGEIVDIVVDDGSIKSVRLSSGEQVSGDLFIDCSGPARRLLAAVGGTFARERDLVARASIEPSEQLGPPHRTVEANGDGWTSKTHLLDGANVLSVRDGGTPKENEGEIAISLGRIDQPWQGNCVALGQAAAVLDPLTVAPMMLLQRDIERLLDLIPVLDDQAMERREFNRRFENDVTHAQLFQSAFFKTSKVPDSPYWQAAAATAVSNLLDRKIDQFENRGLLVRYDLEPFNDEDWLMLHAGMGRGPERYDRQLDGKNEAETARQLSTIKQTVAQMISRMPPHHVYVANLKHYLEKQSHG